MNTVVSLVAAAALPLRAALPDHACRRRRPERDRGDVPGWVMITLMSAVLVMGLLAIAGPALEGLFQQAISKVSK